MTDLEVLTQQLRNRKSGCFFCTPPQEIILFDTDFFRVIIDTFPIAPCHIMISTKQHYGCAGEIPQEKMAEFTTVKRKVQNILKNFSDDMCFYEHGRAGGCTTVQRGLKCEHFHLHCLPTNVDISQQLHKTFPSFALTHHSDIIELFFEHGNYLYFQTPSRQQFFYPSYDLSIAPHYLRTLVCQAIQREDLANWESVHDPSLLRQSYDKLAPFISSHKTRETLV